MNVVDLLVGKATVVLQDVVVDDTPLDRGEGKRDTAQRLTQALQRARRCLVQLRSVRLGDN
jgi:hypothetical protein